MRELSFFVAGRPAPKGSKRGGAAGQLREASRYLPAWTWAVHLGAVRARIAANWETATRPCQMGTIFFFDRPANPVPHAQDEPAVPPDVDKLLRAVADPLTVAGVWRDDALWTAVGATRKVYVGTVINWIPMSATRPQGAYITIITDI